MDSATLEQTLSTIHTFEDYEKLKGFPDVQRCTRGEGRSAAFG